MQLTSNEVIRFKKDFGLFHGEKVVPSKSHIPITLDILFFVPSKIPYQQAPS
jgi:hypothetical protein